MKNRVYKLGIALLFCFGVVFFSQCKKEKTNPPTPKPNVHEIVGNWLGEIDGQEVVLHFGVTGEVDASPNTNLIGSYGLYEIDQQVISFSDSLCDLTSLGHYKFLIKGDLIMEFEFLEDDCTTRKNSLINKTWTRQE